MGRAEDIAGTLSRELEEICALLLNADAAAVEAAAERLEAAADEFRVFAGQPGGNPPEPGMRPHFERLKERLRQCRNLLESAAEFHGRRAMCLAALAQGYQAGGAPAALPHGNRIVFDA